MVSLTDIFAETKETLQEFMNRTYWTAGNWKEPAKVHIYQSMAQKKDPEIKPDAIWELEQAALYAQTLRDTEPAQNARKDTETAQKSIQSFLVEITTETLNEPWSLKEWQDSVTGEVSHRFERT